MKRDLVFSIERINASALRGQQRHDTRSGGNLDHVDQKRSHLNQVLHGSGKCIADVKGLMREKGVKVRKDNENPFTRIVLSASPEHLADPKNREKFVSNSMEFLREKWGDGLAYAVLHLDEKTPHIHAVVVPLVQSKRGTISSHHNHPATKGLNSYERLRRYCAARLDLDYGVPGTKPVDAKMGQVLQESEIILAHAKLKAEDEKRKIDLERQRLEEDRAQLNRERSEHAARANHLHVVATHLQDVQAAKRAKLLASSTRPLSSIDLEAPAPAQRKNPPQSRGMER